MPAGSSLRRLESEHELCKKVAVNGSSSFAIRSKFKDSLAGRKIVFNIYPLDFGEFLEFRGRKDLADSWNTANLNSLEAGIKFVSQLNLFYLTMVKN